MAVSVSTAPSSFSPWAVIWMVTAGIVSFIAFLLILAYGPELEQGQDGRTHAASVSATGYKGLVTLIGALDTETEVLRNDKDSKNANFLIVTPEWGTSASSLAEIVKNRQWAQTLIILPKWRTSRIDDRPGWVEKTGTIDARSLSDLVKEVVSLTIEQKEEPLARIEAGEGIPAAPLRSPAVQQRISGNGLHPILLDEKGRIVLARIGSRSLYILAEPDLVNNQGLKDPETARAAAAMIETLSDGDTVSFDLTLNGFARKPNLLKLAFEPPFLTLTLCVFFAALLAGLSGAYRFGMPIHERRAVAFGKRALLDNSAALIRAAKREHSLTGRYAILTRDAVTAAIGAPSLPNDATINQFLDRLGGSNPDRYKDLELKAKNARTGYEILEAAQALYHWRKDKTRDR